MQAYNIYQNPSADSLQRSEALVGMGWAFYGLDDVLKDIRRNKIQMNKRVSTGMLSKYYPNWLIIINGIKYKLAINFADTGALQGNISFGDNLKNLEMGTDVKNLMDDYKTNMLYGLLKHPDKWKKYALGDLSVYDVYKKFSGLIKKGLQY